MATDYQEAIRILSEQEKILQFDSFTSEDAWKLGNIMVEEIRNQGIDLTVSIRKMNGHIIFAYASEGANLNHQNWTDRKFNMVSYMECSSLLATARAHFLGRSLVEDFGLNYEEYKLWRRIPDPCEWMHDACDHSVCTGAREGSCVHRRMSGEIPWQESTCYGYGNSNVIMIE